MPYTISPLFRDHAYAGRSLLFFHELASTNLLCLRDQELLSTPGLVVMAQRQTQGIGRMGRRWESGQGRHLFCSFVLHLGLPREQTPGITLVTGLAVYNSLAHLGAKDLSIKWPNDILICGRKVCGILCQSGSVGPDNKLAIVAGIGVNITGDRHQFPRELWHRLTTLQEVGIEVSPRQLLEVIAKELERLLVRAHETGLSPLLQQWLQSSCCLGKRITFCLDGQECTGTITGLDNHGRLLVLDDQAMTHRVESGQIEFQYGSKGRTS